MNVKAVGCALLLSCFSLLPKVSSAQTEDLSLGAANFLDCMVVETSQDAIYTCLMKLDAAIFNCTINSPSEFSSSVEDGPDECAQNTVNNLPFLALESYFVLEQAVAFVLDEFNINECIPAFGVDVCDRVYDTYSLVHVLIIHEIANHPEAGPTVWEALPPVTRANYENVETQHCPGEPGANPTPAPRKCRSGVFEDDSPCTRCMIKSVNENGQVTSSFCEPQCSGVYDKTGGINNCIQEGMLCRYRPNVPLNCEA